MILGLVRLVIIGSIAFLAACAPTPTPFSHEAYVWQRAWTAPLNSALLTARDTFAAYRVLALHSDRAGELIPIDVDIAALALAARPVVAVVRLDGFDPNVDTSVLALRLEELAQRWRAAGVALAGIEIDHDCAVSRLADYASRLHSLRAALPRELRMSITALPTWSQSPALDAVLSEADEVVLQVHAVQNPAAGLFQAVLAERWVRAFATRTPRPFRVALPAYGARVGFDDEGHAVGVESETPRFIGGVRQEELRVKPQQVADLLASLARSPPPHLIGIVWFRLPLPDDRRAWSLTTLRAVIDGQRLDARLEVTQKRSGPTVDLLLHNRSAVDTSLPAQILVQARECRAADALRGYTLEPTDAGWRFIRSENDVLKAGAERAVGWLNCDIVDKVEWHEDP